VLFIRGTKKLRDRVNGAPVAEPEESTTALGDWFANALFWRPQVALLVNSRTLLPVFMELAPAATLLERAPPRSKRSCGGTVSTRRSWPRSARP